MGWSPAPPYRSRYTAARWASVFPGGSTSATAAASDPSLLDYHGLDYDDLDDGVDVLRLDDDDDDDDDDLSFDQLY